MTVNLNMKSARLKTAPYMQATRAFQAGADILLITGALSETKKHYFNLLNEIRGVSAVMLCGGIIILLGTVIPQLTLTSFIVAILILLGFAVGRFISIGLDGKPNKLIIQGIIFELVLGAANSFCLVYTLV